MNTLVIYESMYGTTHLIADAVGAGLEAACDVRVLPVARVSPADLANADLVIVGGPTHAHGMSRAATRQAAVKAAGKTASSLTVEPGAAGPGLREWFATLGQCHVKAAAFDTRFHGPALLTGRASKGLARALRRRGFEVIAKPESFLVTKQNRLEPQEASRARAWAAGLVKQMVPTA